MVARSSVNQGLYEALTVLQHRGQDAAGMVTCEGMRLFRRKDAGLVRDVFREEHMQSLQGNMGIAHVRYPTAGSCSSAESQPFYVNSPYGISLAHNGNLTNGSELLREVCRGDLRHINTNSDSEVLLNVFAHELQAIGSPQPTPEQVFQAVTRVHQRCRGAYAVVALLTGFGLVAFRDPHGIRPLCYGLRDSGLFGPEYMVASESVALDALGFELIRDVAPGEAIYIERSGKLHTQQCAENPKIVPCIFEHVYLARPDSILDRISVYKARLRMGERLADKIRRLRPDHDIDVVMPIPDSGRTAALELANHLGVKFREGFIKNRYIGRTFIMPGQSIRRKSVRQKLNPIGLEFKGKVVCLVDDSIVRGTTCQQIIEMARDAGASKVYFASAAPAIRHPNVYGIDMPAADELVAHGRTDEQVAQIIGADWLVYQDLDDLIACAHEGNMDIDEFECSVFNGRYVTGDVDAAYLARLYDERNDSAKNRAALAGNLANSQAIDLQPSGN